VLEEFKTDPWLSIRLDEYSPQLSDKLKVLEKNINDLKNN